MKEADALCLWMRPKDVARFVRTGLYLEAMGKAPSRRRSATRLEEAVMYEPSRSIMTFHIAGFQFWDGALVLDQLKAGIQLRLARPASGRHLSRQDETRVRTVGAE